MTCLNPRPLGKWASVDIIFPRKKIFSYSGADLRVSCRGSTPPPLRRPVGFYYNWYSVLKFVYITSQLCYSLSGATPSKKILDLPLHWTTGRDFFQALSSPSPEPLLIPWLTMTISVRSILGRHHFKSIQILTFHVLAFLCHHYSGFRLLRYR